MAAHAGYYPALAPTPGEDLWCLAYATACDAKEVALEVSSQTTSALKVFKTLLTGVRTAYSLRWDFTRLANRQDKLLMRLHSAAPELWSYEDCAKMTHLLDEFIAEERGTLKRALNLSPLTSAWWGKPIARLMKQVDAIEAVSQYMGALSVPERIMAGDQECREFLTSLNAPEEHDFTVDPDHRKACLHA